MLVARLNYLIGKPSCPSSAKFSRPSVATRLGRHTRAAGMRLFPASEVPCELRAGAKYGVQTTE